MNDWPLASGLAFVYATAVAALLPRLPGARRRGAILFCAAGLALSAASAWLPHVPVLHDWLIPPVLLLLFYWTTGLLFVAPMPRVERLLMETDRALRMRDLAARAPRPIAEFLEFAYAAVYADIVVALAIFLIFTPDADAGRFWSVILTTDYICFGLLPWVQTRTPRSLESGEPWCSSFRRFNLRFVSAVSINVNTFPSGHAAEALAAALLVLDAPLPLVIWMFFNALAISAGAVLGRYHYALDAFTGWAVAIAVWMLL